MVIRIRECCKEDTARLGSIEVAAWERRSLSALNLTDNQASLL